MAGVRDVEPGIQIMLHIALGGQNKESRFFIDNMLARHLEFDVIGESYYPQWHGTLQELEDNLKDLAGRYKKDVVVVEYSRLYICMREDKCDGGARAQHQNCWSHANLVQASMSVC